VAGLLESPPLEALLKGLFFAMFSLLIGFALCIATSLVLQFAVGISVWISVLAGLAVFTLAYFLLMRSVMKKVNLVMEAAQRDLQAGRTEKAVKTLQGALKYAPWQLYVKEQVHSQIGSVLYMKRDFSAAFEYLKGGFVRHWIAMAMLGICYMRRTQNGLMIKTFEKALTGNRKEDMLYSVYAFCLDKIGDRKKAIEVLEKGLKKAANTEIMQENIDLLKAGKKMKMKGYGDMWLQFHLEKPGVMIKHQTKAIQGRRKIVRR
jgi:tetratricopeptide (TPR) repeat protein